VREDSTCDSVTAPLILTTLVVNCVIKTKIRQSKQFYSNKPQTFIQLCGLRDFHLFEAVNSPHQMIHLFNQNANLQKHRQNDAYNDDNKQHHVSQTTESSQTEHIFTDFSS